MTVEGWVDVAKFKLDDPQQAESWFRDWQSSIGSDGRGAFVFHLGPVGTARNSMPLTVCVDFDAGRAAVRWGDRWGVENGVPDFHQALELEDGDADVVVPNWAARVTPGAARRVVADFVATGEQPESLLWVEGE